MMWKIEHSLARRLLIQTLHLSRPLTCLTSRTILPHEVALKGYMMRWQSNYTIAAVISLAVGLTYAVLPGDWIESRLGVDPDGGNGLLEALVVFVTLAIALVFAVRAVKATRRSTR